MSGNFPKGHHPAFEPPSNPNIRVWRYMDFTQFVSVLERRGLFFTRGDLFEDKFEGTMSRWLHDFLEAHSLDPQQHAMHLRMTKGWSFVNCWHMNEVESAAMWKIYSTSKESVCVQSTYTRLREALDGDVYIGVVNYIDYKRDTMPPNNVFWPLTYKRKSFEHERELRAVWSDIASIGSAGPAVASFSEYQPAPQAVVWKDVNLSALVENVFVSPTAKPWFLDLLRNVLNTYGVKAPVHQSDLAADPLF
jgi:hypothetical protein